MATVKTGSNNIVDSKKEQIINVARKLFSEYTYLGVSMSDIAKKINITKGALYYHFTGKVEIYQKVLDDVFSNLKVAIEKATQEQNAKNRLSALTENYLKFGLQEKNLIKTLMLKLSPNNKKLNDYITKLRGQMLDLIEPVIKSIFSAKKKNINSRMVSSLFVGMMDELLLEYSLLNKKINIKKVSEQIIAVLF